MKIAKHHRGIRPAKHKARVEGDASQNGFILNIKTQTPIQSAGLPEALPGCLGR